MSDRITVRVVAGALSGRLEYFTAQELQKVADQINTRSTPLIGGLNPPDDLSRRGVSLHEASHVVLPTAKVKHGILVVEIEILNTLLGDLLKTLLAETGTVRPVLRGDGKVSSAGTVENFKLMSVDFAPVRARQPDIIEKIGELADSPDKPDAQT